MATWCSLRDALKNGTGGTITCKVMLGMAAFEWLLYGTSAVKSQDTVESYDKLKLWLFKHWAMWRRHSSHSKEGGYNFIHLRYDRMNGSVGRLVPRPGVEPRPTVRVWWRSRDTPPIIQWYYEQLGNNLKKLVAVDSVNPKSNMLSVSLQVNRNWFHENFATILKR